ncbi:MAG: hypothetical protein AOA66_0964 [Candidatus Bathyarchaeota archaeon BA2]|nr:MAG: hypothetical protein AOA66_0964 [Candidatus Bathyarchaeota archaeon BA2]
MAKYNPFAEKAGMKKVLESKPNPAVLEAVEKLRKLVFNPVFLSSEKYNMHRLQVLQLVGQVKTVLKDLSKAGGYTENAYGPATKPTCQRKSSTATLIKHRLRSWQALNQQISPNQADFTKRSMLASEASHTSPDWWAGPDLNRRPQPRKGCFRSVRCPTMLDDRPIVSK